MNNKFIRIIMYFIIGLNVCLLFYDMTNIFMFIFPILYLIIISKKNIFKYDLNWFPFIYNIVLIAICIVFNIIWSESYFGSEITNKFLLISYLLLDIYLLLSRKTVKKIVKES